MSRILTSPGVTVNLARFFSHALALKCPEGGRPAQQRWMQAAAAGVGRRVKYLITTRFSPSRSLIQQVSQRAEFQVQVFRF